MASTEKYCDGCVFFRPDTNFTGADALKFGHCWHTAAQEPPSIDRFVSAALDTPPTYKYASIFRGHGECGPDAKLFEAAPTPSELVAA